MKSSDLALFGGPKAVTSDPKDVFKWPIITKEDEAAALDVLRRGAMSHLDVTQKFEAEYGQWQGAKFALAFSSGTASLQAAMWACGVRRGDEVICPSVTYWASCLPVYSLGGMMVFADIHPRTLCINPNDIEHRITKRTKAIIAVHYCGHPCDMTPIMKVARKHKLKVIEDVSHAHGGLYKGKKVGNFGDVACFSLMSGKSLAIGEAGMLTTNNRDIYEHALAWGHYERFDGRVKSKELAPYAGLPMGGSKYRMHQISSAVGRVHLKHYDKRIAVIQKAMNLFWDLLEGVPGLQAHRPERTGDTMGGWYAATGLYRTEDLGGLSVTRFCEAVRAEGATMVFPGVNRPLHLHPIFNEADIYGDGKPTRIALSSRDLRQKPGSLPVSEAVMTRTFHLPWFKHYRPALIKQYANAFRKASAHYRELLPGDHGNPPTAGGWSFFRHERNP